jgi:hypothetical protein
LPISDRPPSGYSQRPSRRPSHAPQYENQSIPPSVVRSRAAVAAISLFLFGTFLVAGIVRSCRSEDADEKPAPIHTSTSNQLPR